ncbi:hypothetical protein [Snodgrassella alvi]|jgi:hypothetical protein|uniref:hypothetical protein n=1 Tax=Snodgrassella alvi TaxID=1196083 RepID=UPI0015D52B8C|nr:hypothetical protein [Snodgrassella alvi]
MNNVNIIAIITVYKALEYQPYLAEAPLAEERFPQLAVFRKTLPDFVAHTP